MSIGIYTLLSRNGLKECLICVSTEPEDQEGVTQ